MTKTAEKAKKKRKHLKVYITVKQRKAMECMVENGGIASRAMIAANYSPQTAKVPSKLTKSKGFLALCNEIGLTDELLTGCLVEDIIAKPQRRHKELELGFKVRGLLRETPEEHKENISNISYDRARNILIREIHIRE